MLVAYMSSYLVAFKPPAKEMAADALEDLWNNCKSEQFLDVPILSMHVTDEEARAAVKPYLTKVRPNAVATNTPVVKKEESTAPGPLIEPSIMSKTGTSPTSVAAAG